MAKQKKPSSNISPRIVNRKAKHDYHIHEKLEVGLVLQGSEVKSIRAGQVSLNEGFCRVEPKRMELFLHGVHINEYANAGPATGHEPAQTRKLLAHKREIERLVGATSSAGRTIVPLAMYFNSRGICKLEIAVVSGKKQHDKRRDIAKRDVERDMRKAMTRKVL